MKSPKTRQQVWEEILDNNLCGKDPITGNRTCDEGMFCGKCHDKFYTNMFEKRCKELDIEV